MSFEIEDKESCIGRSHFEGSSCDASSESATSVVRERRRRRVIEWVGRMGGW